MGHGGLVNKEHLHKEDSRASCVAPCVGDVAC